ncbi:MAG: hypothetical protein VZT48_11230 [Bulleidia sp.]|nr:hypothetical protein [Bulleidia sp.]
MNTVLETKGIESLSVEECIAMMHRCMNQETQQDAQRLNHLPAKVSRRCMMEVRTAFRKAGRKEALSC